MTAKTYRRCKFCGDFHDVDDWPDNHREYIPDNRNYDLAAPSVVNDSIELQSMADGKMYTSKRVMARESRARGFVEVGNEDPGAHRVKPDTKKHREEVKAAVHKAASEVSLKNPTRTARQIKKIRRKERHAA
ncbi:MAG: hypothetical protein AAGB16_01025 [Pseudomonadota bacterium]